MNISKNIEKALEHYSQGNYDDALNICKKIIKKDSKNVTALEMAAYILYLKGNIDKSKKLWNYNATHNNNQNAKLHLKNIDEYVRLKNLFVEALEDMSNKRYSSALDKLVICQDSEFNKFHVGQTIENCSLLKIGVKIDPDYISNLLKNFSQKSNEEKAFEENIKILNIKPKSEINSFNTKTLFNMANYKNLSKSSAVVAAIALVFAFSYIIIEDIDFTTLSAKEQGAITNITPEVDKPENIPEASSTIENDDLNLDDNFSDSKGESPKIEDDITSSENENIKSEDSVTEAPSFPTKDFQTALNNKETNKLYALLMDTPKEAVSKDNIKLYEQAEKHMKTDGVKTLYYSASKKLNNKDFKGAAESFKKALTYASNDELEPHILYLLAVASENSDNIDDALKYFIQYVNKYSNGHYTAESLYRIVTLSKDTDIETAKAYANVIKTNFSNSIYYNNTVKNVLKK